jgi:glycosyltransferase involved in cell wall biosynthesis
MPTVSICLPVYNGANFLAQAIESVLAQTYGDFELLIANDCSTDQTPEIIQSYAKSDPRIKTWTNEKNLKLFGNYNRCIEKAAGKYIKLFAHDDLFHPTLLERMVEILDTNPDVSLVVSSRCWIDADGNRIEAESETAAKIMKPFSQDIRLSAAEAIAGTLKDIMNWLGEPCSQMFRKEYADGGYDTSFRQIGDLEYSYRLLQHGDYYFIADDLCYFRRHAQSWSQARSFDLTAYLDWFLLAAKYKQFVPNTGLTNEEYSLSLLQAVTKNLAFELHSIKRTSQLESVAVLKELLSADPLSFFNCEKGSPRNLSQEWAGVGTLAFLQCVFLENELRRIEKEKDRNALEIERFNLALRETKAAMQRDIDSLNGTLTEKDLEIKELRDSLSDMGSSMSWKVTAPLRRLKRGLRAPSA